MVQNIIFVVSVIFLIFFPEVILQLLNVQRCEYPYEYYDCGSFCQNACDSLRQACNISTFKCSDKCYCLQRFARDQYNNCIPEWQCPQLKAQKNKCLGVNEVFKCGSECQTTCVRLGKECPIVNKKCKNDCYCIDGYARDADGVCIIAENCPDGRCEFLNEVHFCNYFPCQTNCSTIGKCVINKGCVEGCYCEKGYVRGVEGDCLPEWLCYHQ